MSPSNEIAKCVLILILEYNELQFKTHLLLVEYHKTQIKINQYNYIQLGFFCFFPHYTEWHSEHLLRSGQCASCVHAGGLSCFVDNFALKAYNTMRISFFEIPAQTTIEYFTITTKYASFSRYAFLSYYLTGLKLHTTKKILSKNAPSGVCSGRFMGGGRTRRAPTTDQNFFNFIEFFRKYF